MDTQLALALLAGAVIVLVGVLAVRLSYRLGLPGLLLYLGLGMALGESGLGIRFDDAVLTRNLGLIALAVILAEGGLTTRLSQVRPVLGRAAVLATVGVAVSVLVVATAVHSLLSMDWRTAVLLGAVVSSTDAAAVFSVLRQVRLPARLRGLLEAESGFNDAPVVVLVAAVSAPSWGTRPAWQLAPLMVYELAAGAAAGLLVGWAGRQLLARIALPASGLYPLAAMAITAAAYSGTVVLHASGFLAVYVCALLLGMPGLPHRRAVLGFAEGLAWLAQIGLFVLLGLLSVPSRLPHAVGPALVAGLALVVLARPLSVLVSAAPFRVPWRAQAFVAWAGLRGAVPIVLATIPLSEGTPSAVELFDTVFVLVLVFTVVQAPTLPWVARRLKVVAPEETGELEVETAPLDELDASLLDVGVVEGSRLAGAYVDDLRLPHGAAVTLVVRDGESRVPDPTTRLRVGDRLVVVATSTSRAAAERRLRAVSRRGSLARWLGEEGESSG